MTEVVERDYDFDEVASLVVEWMRSHGYPDAELTPDAGTGLYDVDSQDAIAEVNIGAPPSRPHVQRLDQVAREVGRQALYFSARGFTAAAEEWADNVRIALFACDKDGEAIVPVNALAAEMASEPPSPEERLVAAATRALESELASLHEEVLLRNADQETAERIREARDVKRMRRNLFG